MGLQSDFIIPWHIQGFQNGDYLANRADETGARLTVRRDTA